MHYLTDYLGHSGDWRWAVAPCWGTKNLKPKWREECRTKAIEGDTLGSRAETKEKTQPASESHMENLCMVNEKNAWCRNKITLKNIYHPILIFSRNTQRGVKRERRVEKSATAFHCFWCIHKFPQDLDIIIL